MEINEQRYILAVAFAANDCNYIVQSYKEKISQVHQTLKDMGFNLEITHKREEVFPESDEEDIPF